MSNCGSWTVHQSVEASTLRNHALQQLHSRSGMVGKALISCMKMWVTLRPEGPGLRPISGHGVAAGLDGAEAREWPPCQGWLRAAPDDQCPKIFPRLGRGPSHVRKLQGKRSREGSRLPPRCDQGPNWKTSNPGILHKARAEWISTETEASGLDLGHLNLDIGHMGSSRQHSEIIYLDGLSTWTLVP